MTIPCFINRGYTSTLAALIVLITATLPACQPLSATCPTPDVKGPIILLEPSGTNIPIYDYVPVEGVVLTATSPSPGRAEIEITGLNPNESIVITIRAEGEGWSQKVEIWSIAADKIGTYETSEGLRVQGKGSPIEWKVQIIHARGVACATVEVINP